MRYIYKPFLAVVVGFVAGCASLPGGLWKSGAAQAGPSALASGAPSWCAGADTSEMRSSYKRAVGLETSGLRQQLYALIATTCAPDDEARAHTAELTEQHQKWSARLDLTEDDWTDFVAWANLPAAARGSIDIQRSADALSKRPLSSLDPIEQWDQIALGSHDEDPSYLVDALGSHLAELGRLAYVAVCIASPKNVLWATCQSDIDRLDYKKVAAEIRASTKYAPAQKALLRFHIGINLQGKLLPEHTEKIKKLVASDPGYAKMFQVTAAAGKAWSERYRTNTKLLQLVAELEEAQTKNTRSALAGCEDRTWDAWKAVVATIPAKAYEDLSASNDKDGPAKSFLEGGTRPIIDVPDGYLASIALVMCTPNRDAKIDALVWSLGKATKSFPGFRGPRTAAQTALLSANITFDGRGSELSFPTVIRPFARELDPARSARGVIAKLTPAGETVTVAFKQQMITERQCDDYKTTSKIIQFRTDGSPVYDTICTRSKNVTFDSADPPQTVNARYLQGAKPGMYVSIVGDVALGVWAKSTSTTPVLVYGVPVK